MPRRIALPDHLAPKLNILFVGINPGLRSVALGHHYAGPSNRFWKLLYDAKLVPERLTYQDDGRLPHWGLGLTNLVARPTAGLADLTARDLAGGRQQLVRKVRRYHPRVVALLGMTLYPALFPHEPKRPTPRPGLQTATLHEATIVLLPNPSGRNAGYSYQSMLEAFHVLAAVSTARDIEKPGSRSAI
ncbi:MAG: mismatch-specific DNA-glycosylase [Nitrospira sp.]|nr:mismatch-specific DNA-glycosylase [Nitrospira sp.]MBS0172931.1 mismatch-specific DNA-glycosylase [Nitrospira sp.]MBX3339166.1 mismatch-specific DNA-glycosylase [Nitrospira sp.]MCW5778596.1 mismatch-specific DNA-glycosylase [Nitrospira sp.]HMZ53321.1 mismatch-specific DNA-glycosylase [Nitrospira sp.]